MNPHHTHLQHSAQVCINPADSEAVPPGSRLICLAPSTAALSSEPSTEALALHALAAQAAEMRMRPRRRSAWWGGGGSGVGECEQPRSIIVAGWPREHIQDLQVRRPLTPTAVLFPCLFETQGLL